MPGSLFITGATGYVGRHVLASLRPGRYERVVCLARGATSVSAGVPVDWVAGEVAEPGRYTAALAGCQTVLHLAAATGKNSPAEYFRTNRDGTRALAQAACQAGVRRFLYVSTIAVNFTRYVERYPYALSKREGEQMVMSSGVPYTIARPALVLGAGAPVLQGLERLAAAPVVPVFGTGLAAAQPVFVEDLAACLLCLAEEDRFEGRTVEIGGPQVLTMQGLLEEIRSGRCGRRMRAVHVPMAPVMAGLTILEKFLLPWLPLTAGQLASFANDGTARADPDLAAWQSRAKGAGEVLRSLYSHANRTA